MTSVYCLLEMARLNLQTCEDKYQRLCAATIEKKIAKWKRGTATSSKDPNKMIAALLQCAVSPTSSCKEAEHDSIISIYVDDFLEETSAEREEIKTAKAEIRRLQLLLNTTDKFIVGTTAVNIDATILTTALQPIYTRYDGMESRLSSIEQCLLLIVSDLQRLSTNQHSKAVMSIGVQTSTRDDDYSPAIPVALPPPPPSDATTTASPNAPVNINIMRDVNWIESDHLKGHMCAVASLCQLRDGRLVSGGGSMDVSIRIWDLTTKTSIETIHAHSESVRSLLQLADGRLLSGSADKTIKIWDFDTSRKLLLTKTLTGHKRAIVKVLQLKDRRVISGAEDGSIRVWDIISGECTQIINCYQGELTQMILLQDGRVATLGYTGSINVWDTNDWICTTTHKPSAFQGCSIDMCQLSDGCLLIASGKSRVTYTLTLWNAVTNDAKHFTLYNPIEKLIRLCPLTNGLVACTTNQSYIKLLDPNTKGWMQTICKGPNASILYPRQYCVLELRDGSLATGRWCHNNTTNEADITLWKLQENAIH